MLKKRKLGLLLLIAIMVAMLFYYFGPIITSPDSYFMAYGGDASKNYFIPAYYAKYDHGIHFSGMNYPYGEHIQFTDGQFPVSLLMQLIQHTGINVADHTSAIINYMMLFSILLSAIFLFLLLTELRIATWFAIIAAIGITFLSPQVQRMTAHFSLAYQCFLPAMFYFLLKLTTDKRKWRWVIAQSLLMLFFGFLHLYNAMVAGAFLLSFSFFYFIISKIKKQFSIILLMQIILTAIVPLLLLQTFMLLTDHVSDRIQIPWGFDFGYANFKSVFFPPDWNRFSIIPNNQQYQEGYAYVGVLVWLAFFLFVLRQFFAFSISFSKRFFIPSINQFVLIAALASVPVLLYAMQYPWCLNLRWLMEELPVVRQFRAIGRFTWPFYYAMGIFAAYYFFVLIRLFKMKGKIIQAAILAIIASGLWLYEGSANVKQVINSYTNSKIAKEHWPNADAVNALLKAGLKPSDFQAILALPFYHLGSEKFWLDASASLEESMKLSYNTGLPIADAYFGRTSVSQSANLIQLVSNPLIEKKVLNDLQSSKPFLLMVTHDQLRETEKQLVAKADSITTIGNIILYRLPLKAFEPEFEKARADFFAKKDSMFHFHNYWSSKVTAAIIDLPMTNNESAFLSNGIYNDSGRVDLYSGKIALADSNQRFHLSCWIKIYTQTYDFPWFTFRHYDGNHQQTEEQTFTIKNTEDVYNGWARLNFDFTLSRNDSVSCFLRGKKTEVSRLLIQPFDVDVFSNLKADGSFVMNNFFVPAKKL